MSMRFTWFRKKSTVAALIGLVAIAVPAVAVAVQPAVNDNSFSYSVGLWGDLPYSAAQATVGVPNIISDMNASDIAFSVHDGDLKAGNGPTANPPSVICDDSLYTSALGWFNSLKAPAMFTTGDNDWTDCDRPSNGSFNSLERLDHERAVFFSTASSMGQDHIRQDVQSEPSCLGYVSGPAAGPTSR
jgi:hypothetical protein